MPNSSLRSAKALKSKEARMVTPSMVAAMGGPMCYGKMGLDMAMGFICASLLFRALTAQLGDVENRFKVE